VLQRAGCFCSLPAPVFWINRRWSWPADGLVATVEAVNPGSGGIADRRGDGLPQALQVRQVLNARDQALADYG